MKRENKIMTKKEAFITIVEAEIFSSNIYENDYPEEYKLAESFWEDFKNGKSKSSEKMTENGAKLLSWMQENVDKMSNIFTSKEMAEALFTSGRSIAGSMRKLIKDGYVEKIGKDPVQYSLTEAGKSYQFEK